MLEANANLFAWCALDMLEIDLEFNYHKLAICPKARPVAQRKRKLGLERGKVVDEEVVKYKVHQRSAMHHVVSQCDDRKEVQQEVEDVH